jgi:hypothetical protein
VKAIARIADGVRWLGGPLLWAAHFLILYTSESLVCSRAGAGAGSTTFAMIATLTTIGAMALIAMFFRPRADAPEGAAMMDRVGAMLLIGSAGAVLLTAMSALLIDACASNHAAIMLAPPVMHSA